MMKLQSELRLVRLQATSASPIVVSFNAGCNRSLMKAISSNIPACLHVGVDGLGVQEALGVRHGGHRDEALDEGQRLQLVQVRAQRARGAVDVAHVAQLQAAHPPRPQRRQAPRRGTCWGLLCTSTVALDLSHLIMEPRTAAPGAWSANIVPYMSNNGKYGLLLPPPLI